MWDEGYIISSTGSNKTIVSLHGSHMFMFKENGFYGILEYHEKLIFRVSRKWYCFVTLDLKSRSRPFSFCIVSIVFRIQYISFLIKPVATPLKDNQKVISNFFARYIDHCFKGH